MTQPKQLIGLVLAAVLCSAASGSAEAQKADYAKIRLDPSGFNPAATCGQCHVDIYTAWKESMHAKALSDPTFQATFQDPKIQGSERLRKLCVQCHAPAAHYDAKLSVRSPLAGEGVTCDFCHSIQGVDLKNTAQPFDVQRGKLKRGPFKDTESPVHDTRQSPHFESPELCGGCHEMANVNGVPLITTWSEWRDLYAKRPAPLPCQGCHMPLSAGVTVSASYQKIKRRVNLHSFPGGHSRAQLLDALDVKVVDTRYELGKMKVTLGLTNTGAGHSIPTGNPLRKLVVDFSAFNAANKLLHHEEAELARTYVNKEGKLLGTDLDILLSAVKVAQDNRIPPGATRQVAFEFPAPNDKVLVDVKVSYVYKNDALPKLARRVELVAFAKVVGKAGRERTPADVKPAAEASAKPGADSEVPKVTLVNATFNPASKCGQCHVDIYGSWKDSIHSKAMTDPAFKAAFADRQIQRDDRLKERCLGCHAPTHAYDPRLSLLSGVATEGITCDFCHSVQELDPKNAARPFVVAAGGPKRGPFTDSQSPAHDTKHAAYMEKGEFCGGCHEMANAGGVPVITTFSEWRDQYQATGGTFTCQGCHMPLGSGLTVAQNLQKMKRRINLHDFPGGHSRAQLLDALEIKLLESTRTYGKMKVKLGLSNVGAGHAIPTGNPLRQVVIDFSAYSALNRLVHKEQVVLAKKLVDKDGKELTTDTGVLLRGVKVASDNRIAPKTTRELTFDFTAPDERLLIEARVTYVYRSEGSPKLARKEKLLSFSTIVNRQETSRQVDEDKVLREPPGDAGKK